MRPALILIIMLFATTGMAQHPHFWNLTEDEGLPTNVVYDIMEDSKGYIWIGTDRGLVRYSGQSLETFTSSAQKSLAITGLQEDENGRIWGVNFSRQVFYVQNDSLFELEIPEHSNPNGHVKIELIGSDLFVYSYSRADRLDLRTMEWTLDFAGPHWPISENGPERKLLHSISGEGSSYAMNFSGEIQIVEKETLKFQVRLPYRNKHHRSAWHEDSQYLVPHEFIPLLKIDSDSGDTIQVPVAHPLHSSSTRILVCTDDNRGGLWLCTSEGARELETTGSEMGRVFFPEFQISRVIKDREGNLWFSTLQHGVRIVPNAEILVFNDQNSSLTFNEVSSLGVDGKGNVLLGSFNGVAQKMIDQIGFLDPIELAFSKEVNGFVNFQEEVFAYGEKIISIKDQSVKSIGRPVSIKQVEPLGGNNMALLTSEGFAFTDFSGSNPQLPDHWKLQGSESYQGLSLSRAGGYRKFQKGRSDTLIYLSSTDGLFAHTPSGSIELKAEDDSSIYSLDMALDDDGVVWASTVSQGIIGFNGTELQVSIGMAVFEHKVQFSSIDISNGVIWVAGNDGLYRIDSESLEWEKFDVTDGLPTNSINDLAIAGGYIWLATMKGLVRIPENHSSINSKPPILAFKTIQINEEENLDLTDLKYHENNLAIQLAPISIRSRGAAKILYRLLGLSNDWNEVSITENELRFLALAPSDYTFEAKLVNEDGFMSETITKQLQISPPFWQTWWFYLLTVFGLIGLVFGISAFRFREIRKRDAVQHDLRVSELTALKAQMNPHFVFNALNSIQDYILMNQTELANDYLGKFARLMRKTLDQSQQNTVTLAEELELLNLYLELEAIRFEEEFEYSIKVDSGLNTEKVEIPSMIVQPFVENAIKHGLLHKKEDRVLVVDFKMLGSVLECRIEDNGIGLEASRKMNESRAKTHRSFGTGAVKKRLALLNEGRKEQISVEMNDVTDPSKGISGTHVLLRIPILNEKDNA